MHLPVFDLTSGERCRERKTAKSTRGWYFANLREECLHEERCVHEMPTSKVHMSYTGFNMFTYYLQGRGGEQWNGRCDDSGQCKCFPGFSGKFCGERMDDDVSCGWVYAL